MNWYDNEESEILKNNWRMKRILVEPPCRASMKNSGKKRMMKRKRSWKHKVKPCDDLDGALRRYNQENLELRKRKDETLEQRITSSWTISGRKELNHLEENKNKIYVMHILHQFRLMTSNGFGILLIPVERIKRDIA